jgi:protein SCO1/2
MAILGLTGCRSKPVEEGLPFINKADFIPEWIGKHDPGYASIHTVPAFSFTDQDGKTVNEQTVKNKIYVADFFFTRCGSICPRMTTNMKTLQDKFINNDDVIFLSHSVTPELDSVKALKDYAMEKGVISSKWHLLTGEKQAIYSLARKEYFAGDTVGYYSAEDDFLHTENFVLVDKHRRIRGVYNGTLAFEVQRLAEDIEVLLHEE